MAILFALALIVVPAQGIAQTPIGSASDGLGRSRIIVKYRSEGMAALDRCADDLSRSGESFSTATRDGSDSLDRLLSRLQLGRHRALLRGPDRETLTQRRARLTARFARLSHAGPGPSRFRRLRPQSFPTAKTQPDLAHVYLVEVGDGRSTTEVAAALAADPHVEYAQPDHLHSLDQSLVFDDPFLTSSGSWGQSFADLWGPERVGAPLVWPRAQGEGIVVAVVDSGLDRFHPDIAANVWVNPGEDLNGDGYAEPEDANGIDDDGNGFIDDLTGFDFANSVDADGDGLYDGPEDVSDADPFDDNGHGTHVAGTIAAVADNGIGLVGIAPRARIMALKGFAAEGSAADSLLWRAVLYAAENGADVVNNSWSCSTPCPRNPLAEEMLEIVEALGTVVVTSAGNKTDDVLFNSPENGRRVLTVGSIGVEGEISSFSNRGWLLDVVAPGGGTTTPSPVFIARRNILSLLSSGTNENELAFAVAENYYRTAGTSMSTPHVAGGVALLLSLRPDLSPAQVRRLIRLSARDQGEIGRDPIFGSGLLDVAALVDEAIPDLDLTIDAPRAGSTHDPADGDLVLQGRAEGTSVASIEIEIGAGLSARVFQPIESFGGSVIVRREGNLGEGRILARWDVSAVADGPYTIRVRAHLFDGRIAEEITIVGIERNQPFLISSGAEEAAAPTISGRHVFWQQDETSEIGSPHDIFGGRFPVARELRQETELTAIPVFEREGDQRNVNAAGRDLVWFSSTEDGDRLERCRWVANQKRCDAEVVAEGEGVPSRAWIGGGWILWMSTRGGVFTLEGCRIERGSPSCILQPLLDPAVSSSWLLQSFDGKTLLLKKGFAEYALCRIEPTTDRCTPNPIEFTSSTFVAPVDPVHHGNLIAFSQAGNRLVFPPGCEPESSAEGCIPRNVFSLRYHACWLDETSRRCDEIPVSESVPFDDAQGLAVSGRRIVWSMGRDVERAAIHFCEFDPKIHECVDQRLTGHVAAARRPAIDGARVVWEDARIGPQAIWGFELPTLVVPRRWRTRIGERFAIPVFGSPGSADLLRYELLAIDGDASRELDVTFKPFGLGRRFGWNGGWLVGQLPEDASGEVHLRIRAMTSGELFTDRTLEMEIIPVVQPKRASLGD
jgi:subtilisin family serine protease